MVCMATRPLAPRDTALKLGNGGDQLEAVVGVPGTGSLAISIAQYLNLVD